MPSHIQRGDHGLARHWAQSGIFAATGQESSGVQGRGRDNDSLSLQSKDGTADAAERYGREWGGTNSEASLCARIGGPPGLDGGRKGAAFATDRVRKGVLYRLSHLKS